MSPQEVSLSYPPGARLLRRTAFILAVLLTPFLLALAGRAMQAWQPELPQRFDAARQVLFAAQADGSVRVLNLRHTVGELGQLRSRERRTVEDIQLAADGQEILVHGNDAFYRYDAHSLSLIAREETALAAASAVVAR